jgi:pyruvate kinase
VSAVHAAYHIDAVAIICITTSGKTAEYISKYRPQCPTVAISR